MITILLVITGNITSKGPGGACVRRRGRLCHGTMAQWPVQVWGTLPLVKYGAGHILSEQSQRTQNGTMFVDLD